MPEFFTVRDAAELLPNYRAVYELPEIMEAVRNPNDGVYVVDKEWVAPEVAPEKRGA